MAGVVLSRMISPRSRVRLPVTAARSRIDVGVVVVDDVSPEQLAGWVSRLSEHERQRATRFVQDADRARFALGRLLVRDVVARRCGVEAAEVAVHVDTSGRPCVPGGPHVSLAHSGRYVVAAAADVRVGIDVEELPRRAQHPALAARVCSPRELGALERRRAGDRDRAFMAIWARKEAYGKAIGLGLEFPLRTITVGPGGSRLAGATGRWRVVDLDIGPDCAAALVAAGRRWVPDLRVVDPAVL